MDRLRDLFRVARYDPDADEVSIGLREATRVEEQKATHARAMRERRNFLMDSLLPRPRSEPGKERPDAARG